MFHLTNKRVQEIHFFFFQYICFILPFFSLLRSQNEIFSEKGKKNIKKKYLLLLHIETQCFYTEEIYTYKLKI